MDFTVQNFFAYEAESKTRANLFQGCERFFEINLAEKEKGKNF
jgi:hypothetical protein